VSRPNGCRGTACRTQVRPLPHGQEGTASRTLQRLTVGHTTTFIYWWAEAHRDTQNDMSSWSRRSGKRVCFLHFPRRSSGLVTTRPSRKQTRIICVPPCLAGCNTEHTESRWPLLLMLWKWAKPPLKTEDLGAAGALECGPAPAGLPLWSRELARGPSPEGMVTRVHGRRAGLGQSGSKLPHSRATGFSDWRVADARRA